MSKTIPIKCNCLEKMKKIVRNRGESINHAWLELPILDTALMIKYVDEMTEEQLMDMCEGFGNTNYSVIVVEQQLVIAGLEEFSIDEMTELLEIRLEHTKH